jgi:hypothetical protein
MIEENTASVLCDMNIVMLKEYPIVLLRSFPTRIPAGEQRDAFYEPHMFFVRFEQSSRIQVVFTNARHTNPYVIDLHKIESGERVDLMSSLTCDPAKSSEHPTYFLDGSFEHMRVIHIDSRDLHAKCAEISYDVTSRRIMVKYDDTPAQICRESVYAQKIIIHRDVPAEWYSQSYEYLHTFMLIIPNTAFSLPQYADDILTDRKDQIADTVDKVTIVCDRDIYEYDKPADHSWYVVRACTLSRAQKGDVTIVLPGSTGKIIPRIFAENVAQIMAHISADRFYDGYYDDIILGLSTGKVIKAARRRMQREEKAYHIYSESDAIRDGYIISNDISIA